jgi:hypothetical protein
MSDAIRLVRIVQRWDPESVNSMHQPMQILSNVACKHVGVRVLDSRHDEMTAGCWRRACRVMASLSRLVWAPLAAHVLAASVAEPPGRSFAHRSRDRVAVDPSARRVRLALPGVRPRATPWRARDCRAVRQSQAGRNAGCGESPWAGHATESAG